MRKKIVRKFNSNPVSAEDIKVGDRVRVLSLDQNGEVLSVPDEKRKSAGKKSAL